MMESKIKETGVIISTTVGSSFKVMDFTAIAQSMEGMQKNPDLVYLGIFGRKNNLISSFNPQELKLDWRPMLSKHDFFYFGEILFYSTPIKFEKEIYGNLLIGYTLKRIHSQINAYTNKGLFICLAIFFVGTLLTIVLGEILTKNLKRLKKSVQNFMPGEKYSKINFEAMDEIGDLSFAFNNLIDEIDLVIKNLKKQSQDLEIAKVEAEKANLAKSEFLAKMSHELRTPMNAILGFSQIMALDTQNPLIEKHRQNLDYISSAGEHLLKLINEVLDLSRIESRNMELSIETINIIPIIDDVISLSKSMVNEKKVSLEYKKTSEENFFVEVDPLRFKQVVLNLISNAIKYNKFNGFVFVSCEKLDSNTMRLGIRDTGHGIAEDKQDRLFAPFERFDQDAELIEGTGIGLTITKNIVELMNGTIGFESIPGEGSFFYVDLPISKKSPAIQIEEIVEPVQPISTNNKKKVLYIEDIPANVELVKKALRHRQDIKLLSAHTALNGIELAQFECPDLILMDIHMPEMDGLTAFKKLQEINETKYIPVIALTADAMNIDIKKALNMGFKDYITKPIDILKFLEKIERILA